jgi:hypothetical protein
MRALMETVRTRRFHGPLVQFGRLARVIATETAATADTDGSLRLTAVARAARRVANRLRTRVRRMAGLRPRIGARRLMVDRLRIADRHLRMVAPPHTAVARPPTAAVPRRIVVACPRLVAEAIAAQALPHITVAERPPVVAAITVVAVALALTAEVVEEADMHPVAAIVVVAIANRNLSKTPPGPGRRFLFPDLRDLTAQEVGRASWQPDLPSSLPVRL